MNTNSEMAPANSTAAGANFTMTVPLAKSWQDENKVMRFEGIASSTSLDWQTERLTPAAIEKMRQYSGLDLLPSHQAGALEELGTIDRCFVDNNQLRIEGSLEPMNSKAQLLFKRLQKGHPYGLSIGGAVLKAHWEEDGNLGCQVKCIDDLILDHVAICRPGHAANPDTYLSALAKAAEFVLEPQTGANHPRNEPAETQLSIKAIATAFGNALSSAIAILRKDGAEAAEEGRTATAGIVTATAEGVPAAAEKIAADEQVALLVQLRQQLTDLSQAVTTIEAKLAKTEKSTAPPLPGRPQSIPGQRAYANNDPVNWKGIL